MNLPKIEPLRGDYSSSNNKVTDVLDVLCISVAGAGALGGIAYGFVMLVLNWSMAVFFGIGLVLLVAAVFYVMIRLMIAHL